MAGHKNKKNGGSKRGGGGGASRNRQYKSNKQLTGAVRNLQKMVGAGKAFTKSPINIVTSNYRNNGRRGRRGGPRTHSAAATKHSRIEPSAINISRGLNSFKFQPGDSGLRFLDWLSTGFDEWRPIRRERALRTSANDDGNSVLITYKSALSTTHDGTVTMGIDYEDKNDIKTRSDVLGLSNSKEFTVYSPCEHIHARLELMRKTRWFTPLKRRLGRQEDKPDIPSLAFTLYLFVDIAEDVKLETLAALNVRYRVQFAGETIQNIQEEHPPTATMQKPAVAMPGQPILKQQTASEITNNDEEEEDDPEDSIAIKAADAPTTDEPNTSPLINEVQLPKHLVPGDMISAVQITDTPATFARMLAAGLLKAENGKLSLKQGVTVTLPKVTLRDSTGRLIPESVIMPLTNQSPKINGVRYSRDEIQSFGGYLDHTSDLSRFNGTGIFGDIFKVIAPLATALAPEATPLIDIASSVLSISYSNPHLSVDSGKIKDRDPRPGPLLIKPEAFDSDLLDFTPEVTSVAIGDSVDVILDPPPVTSLYDQMAFGYVGGGETNGNWKTQKNGTCFPSSLYTAVYDDSGWRGLTTAAASDFSIGEVLSAVCQIFYFDSQEGVNRIIGTFWAPEDKYLTGMTQRVNDGSGFASVVVENKPGTKTAPYPFVVGSVPNSSLCTYTVTDLGANGNIGYNWSDAVDWVQRENGGVPTTFLFSLTLSRTSLATQTKIDIPKPPTNLGRAKVSAYLDQRLRNLRHGPLYNGHSSGMSPVDG